MWAGPGTRPTGERGALPRLPDAAQGERIEQRLLGGPEGDLDLDSHPRCGEAEHVAGVVVTRDRRNPGVLVAEVEVFVIPREVSVSSPLAKKVCGPADPGAIVQLSISIEVCPAPAPPPPTVWKQNAASASPQVWVPSAERSNSIQPQKPPVPPASGVSQIDGLLQLN